MHEAIAVVVRDIVRPERRIPVRRHRNLRAEGSSTTCPRCGSGAEAVQPIVAASDLHRGPAGGSVA